MAARAVPASLAQIPNALTVLRLALIPVFVVLLLASDGGHSWPAAIVFAVAGVTDQIDGWLARRWRVESSFGKIADPLADRLMIDAAIIVLTIDRRLPWAALAIIAFRDGLLAIGGRYLAKRNVVIEVHPVGKAATWILYFAIACSIVTHKSTTWPVDVFWVGLGLAMVAAAIYAAESWKALRR